MESLPSFCQEMRCVVVTSGVSSPSGGAAESLKGPVVGSAGGGFDICKP